MATAKVKRPLAPRTNDVDRLATKFASGLKIADAGTAVAAATRAGASRTQAGRGAAKGKAGSAAKATSSSTVPESPEESKAAAMRSVNGALQILSAAATAADAPDGKSTRATLAATASTGRAALNTLRRLSPGLLDAERAALNLAGKLLALDMDTLALDVLIDVRAHLPSHYPHATEASTTATPVLDVLQLPLPIGTPLDTTLQTCVSAYFTHALPAAARTVVAQPAFCASVDGPAGLKAWVPHLTALPIKARDALLKRAYVALTTATTSAEAPYPPLQVLRVRFCALRILLLSTELEATPFWEQCLKYAAAYARCADAPEKEGERVMAMLACFAETEVAAEGRREGKGWIAFCEYWMALAKRAGDMNLLNRVAAYIRNEASSSNDLASLSVRLCAALTQLTAALDQLGVSGETDDDKLIADADSCSSCLRKLRSFLAPNTALDSKLRRAVEKCRRSCLKSLGCLQTSSRTWDAVRRVSESVVDVLEQVLGADTDATVSALDTLFQLATAGFVPHRADTCDRAYDYLARAARIVEQVPTTGPGSDARACANYTRCLSGAFANVAGTLYKAERHSFSLRFLLQACPLSVRASALYDESREGVYSGADTEGKGRDEPESEKDREAWKAHRTQVYRRWELLGVCYMKIGDRKLAYDAFIQGIVNYPFVEVFQSAESSNSGGPEVQLTAEANRPLVTAIDRLTHLSSVELHLSAADVSLLSPLSALSVLPLIIGAVLMRQVASLAEGGGRAKPGVRAAIGTLLRDLLGVYEPARFPVRRARVLVLVLEHAYYGGDEGTDPNRFHTEEVVQEAQRLLSEKASQYDDSPLVHFRRYYYTMVLLWAVLHAHRTADPVPVILQHANAVIKALEALVEQSFDEPETVAAKANGRAPATGRSRRGTGKSSVDETKGATVTRSKARGAQVQPAQQPAQKTRATRSASTRRLPVTPKPSGTSEEKITTVVHPASTHSPSASEIAVLCGLILMVAELLGLSGLVLAKIQILGLARRLLEKTGDTMNEVYLQSSANLAHELLRLGKTTQATDILAGLASTLTSSSSSGLLTPMAVTLLLRYAEALAAGGDVPKSLAVYDEALRLCGDLPDEEKEKGLPTSARVHARVIALERTAVAAGVFAAIQDARDDATASFKALLQALRLLNRATDTLSRLNPSKKPEDAPDASDPFATSELRDALPETGGSSGKQKSDTKDNQQQSILSGLEWRIANALLETLLALAHAYACRGSAREAEYFAQQAEDLARVLRAPALTARALVRRSEVLLLLGRAEEAQKALTEAGGLVGGVQGLALDAADVCRLRGDRLIAHALEAEARGEYVDATRMLSEVKLGLEQIRGLAPATPSEGSVDIFAPVLQAMILKQQVWLLRDELGEDYETLLEQLLALPQLSNIEVHVNSLLGRLALYDIHERFRSDMSLSSLAESTIALPMGLTCENSTLYSPPQDILEALEQAEEHFASDLTRFSEKDSVMNVRGAAVAAALVSTYQASLGKEIKDSPIFASRLLDMASSITLRRELIDAISFKFPDPKNQNDLQWPSASPASAQPRQRSRSRGQARGLFDDCLSDDDEGSSLDDTNLRKYWDYVLRKHQSQAFIPSEDFDSEINYLPAKWMVISISLTEDKSALLVSRQRPQRDPVIFCVPLRGRRDDEEEEHFKFEDAMAELKDIIQTSDESTRQASKIKPDDKEGKAAWWAERKHLDQRMKELVENIEFCWLGAFKTILGEPMQMPPDIVPSLRTRFEKVFKSILGSHEKKSQKAKLKLENNILELFSTLSPTCKDEELEDLVYFVLDLYHFHGLPIALAEVDMDVVVVDLRTALEEHHARIRGRVVPEPDAHAFLVLDKNVQAIPWESLPILRGRSVSRAPSIAFITDRLALARCQRGLPLGPEENEDDKDDVEVDRIPVDPSKGYFVLNPGGDLSGTEGRFKGWVNDLRKVGWDGIVGQAPSEQQLLNALSRKELVVYFGHGGAEQYVRSHKLRHLQRCAATMLWGCSSGALRDMGAFDRTGTPNNYMLAGCPSLVANLWDVTDRDIDKFAQAVFHKLRLEPAEVDKWRKGKRGPQDGKVSVAAAVAQSRDACKLKYLTGAAVVVYGIPFYL